MTGVEILAMEEVVVERAFNWGVFCGVFAAMIVATIGPALLSASDVNWKFGIFVFFAFGVASVVFAAAIAEGESVPVKYETQYKVTVSDEVSMVEFNEKYEIIDQEGRIYTVRERN